MPPEEAQAPIEMDHLGCGIWSQMRRMTGASLNGSRPAQMSTSAWRGEKLCRSIPKRAMSNRLAAVAMYSIAQQAVPNGIGQSEFLRAQLTRKSSLVVTQLGEIDETVANGWPSDRASLSFNPTATILVSRRTRTPPPG